MIILRSEFQIEFEIKVVSDLPKSLLSNIPSIDLGEMRDSEVIVQKEQTIVQSKPVK